MKKMNVRNGSMGDLPFSGEKWRRSGLRGGVQSGRGTERVGKREIAVKMQKI